jgi:hypothetical protein
MAYATVAQLKAYLNLTGSGDDALLGELIGRAQAAIDRYCDRTFESTPGTRYYAAEDVDGAVLYLDADLLTVALIQNGDGAEIPVSDCVLLPRNATPKYAIVLKTAASWDLGADGQITVYGVWGYSQTPPADIVHATIRLAAYMYRQRDASTFDTVAFPEAGVMTIPQGIPRDVALILEPYRRVALQWA